MKSKWALGVLLSIALGICTAASVHAATYRSSENNEVVITDVSDEGSVYASANAVTIDGQTPNDVFTASGTLYILKPVLGSVFSVAKNITISAPVGRSVRLVGDQIVLNDNISDDVSVVASKLTLPKDASINGDLHFLGANLVLNGHVFGDVYAGGGSIIINGTVNGNVVLSGGNVNVSDTALISGSLTYYSDHEATIAAGVVKGAIDYKVITKPDRWFGSIYSIITTLLFGCVLIFFTRNKLERLFINRKSMPLKDLGIGALFLFGFPIAIIILMMTVIAIPLAIVSLIFYGLMLYAASVITAIFIGMIISDWLKLKLSETTRPYIGLLVGVFVVVFLKMFPLLAVVPFFVMLYVLGMMTRYDVALWRKLRHDKEL